MAGKRDRSQLKFRVLLIVKNHKLGVSKYKLKLLSEITTSKQMDKILTELIHDNFLKLVSAENHAGQKSNYYFLTEKGVDFLEKAENLLKEFLRIED